MIAAAHELRIAPIRLIAVLLLAGCTALQPTMDEEKNTSEPVYELEQFEPEQADPSLEPERKEAKAVPKEKPEIPKRVIDYDRLTGLDERQVENLLGPPDAVSERPPATIWNYVNGPCTLQLSFFLDLDTQRRQVLAYEVATLNPPPNGDQSKVCATTATAPNGNTTR